MCSTVSAVIGGHEGSERTLRIMQWSSFVPAYDTWFDRYASLGSALAYLRGRAVRLPSSVDGA